MKKAIAFITALCLIFGSVSFAFAATQDVSDATTHTRLSTIITWLNNNAPTYNLVNLLNNNLLDVKDALIWNSGESTNNLIYFVKNISNGIDTIASGLSSSSGSSIADILSAILAEFTQTTAGGSVMHFFSRIDTNVLSTKNLVSTISGLVTTINSNIADIGTEVLSSFPLTVQKLTSIDTKTGNIYTLENNTLPGIYAYSGSIDSTLTAYQPYIFSLYGLDNVAGMSNLSGGSAITVRTLYNDGTLNDNTVNLSNKNWRDNIAYILWNANNNLARSASMTVGNYSDTQSRTSWLTNQTQTYTPTSFAKGIYYWLSSIQTPIARLAYVHASDQEISAREKAASNQAKVVNDFVDSSGAGSVSVSDIGSVSAASAQFKTNASTGASATNVWTVFNENNYNWFTTETANNLDTTSSNRRGSSEYDTPLLDSYYQEVMVYIEDEQR